MKRNQKTAFVFAAVILLIAVAYAALYYLFIPEDSKKFIIAIFILLIGTLAAFSANWIIGKLPDSIVVRLLVWSLVGFLIASPFISASMKQVTWSRFGLTVYGVLPIPLLDFTVNEEGALWIRAKTHTITLDEIKALSNSETTVIVIAKGWDSAAQVDDLIHVEFLNAEIHELSTPEAFKKYNELRRQGIRVVLVAHTTC